jgi:hypothetical protein
MSKGLLEFAVFACIGVFIWASLAMGNFMSVGIVGITGQQAFERTFFQLVAVADCTLLFWLLHRSLKKLG